MRLRTPLLVLPLCLALAACGRPDAPPEHLQADAAAAPRAMMAAKVAGGVAEPSQAGRSMAYEHTLELDVDESQVAVVHQALEAACTAAQAEGCVVLESQLGSGRQASARVRLRASPAGIRALMVQMGKAGRVIRQSVQAEDLAEPINDTGRRLKMLEDYRSQLEKLRGQAGRDVDALIKITRELAQTQDEIEALAGQKTQLEKRVNTQLLTVTMTPRGGSTAWQPLQIALEDFGGRLGEGTASLITTLAYGLPWLAVLGGVGWGIQRRRQRRKIIKQH